MAEDYKELLAKLKADLLKAGRTQTSKPSNVAPSQSASAHHNSAGDPKSTTLKIDAVAQENVGITSSGVDSPRSGMASRLAPSNVEITLGIDFGTRFTKVAAFLRQTNQYRVLPLGPGNSRFLHSRIGIDAAEYIYPPDIAAPKLRSCIEYLKMHLASPRSVAFGGNIRVDNIPLQKAIEPLCALYLAGVIRLAINAARKTFAADITQRNIEWFANVGVPVQYCDGDELSRFQKVASVAWQWKNMSPSIFAVSTLIETYEATACNFGNPADSPIQVVPELAAALAHFVQRRTTAEGMYAFFDIGGGTLDGTAFRLIRSDQGKRLNILAAAVDDVGTMAVARHAVGEMYMKMNLLVEQPIIFGSSTPSVDLPISEAGNRIQKLFNRIIREAKLKMPNVEFSDFDRPKLKTIAGPGNYPRYPVFVAGGGAQSEWYADLFKRARQDFSQHQAGIGECDVKVIPAPEGFSGDDYPRFVVAIGLTSDSILFDSYKLPSSLVQHPPMKALDRRIESPVTKDFV